MDFEERLRLDLERLAGDPEAAVLLECLAGHVFDPGHDVGSMLRACGATRQARDRVTAKIGKLKAWVTEVRMTEARRRVCDSEEPIKEIGRSVGYPVKETFRRAFRKAHGKNPSDLRREARLALARAARLEPSEELPAESEKGEGTPPARAARARSARTRAAHIRRLRALGLLGQERAAELHFELRRRHPRLDEDAGEDKDAAASEPTEQLPILLTPTGDYLEDKAAASVFGELVDGPDDQLRFALLHGVRLGNVNAYGLLQRFTLALIPSRPDRALLLAELSAQLIEAHRSLMAEEADQWQALAWTFLAQVQALVGRAGEAEQSLGYALAEVGGADGLAPWVEIELRQVEGKLRRLQRRPAEAVRALDRAVELSRDLPPGRGDRWQVLLERLELATADGDAETGHTLANELQELVGAKAADSGRRLTLWHAFVFYHRARALGVTGDICCAENGLRSVLQYIAEDPTCDTDTSLGLFFTVVLHQLARFYYRRGREEACEQSLRDALERYRWHKAPVLGAVTEAELAVLCALRGGWAEARALASAAAAFLDGLGVHREAWNAARRLRALADGGAGEAESELRQLIETLTSDLDLVASEITVAQARPAFEAQKARQ